MNGRNYVNFFVIFKWTEFESSQYHTKNLPKIFVFIYYFLEGPTP